MPLAKGKQSKSKYQQNRNHHFSTKEEANKKYLNFRISGQKSIPACSNVKYLGMTLNKNLEWSLHLNLLKSKVDRAIGLL